MSVHRYPRNAVIWDYIRSAAGLVLVGAPLAISDTGPIVTAVLCVVAVVFVVYGVRTVARHLARIELDERGLRAAGPGGRSIPWSDLSAVRLKYYSTRRDRSGGWLQLDVTGDHRRVAVESRIEGFDALAASVAAEALAHGVRLDASTSANFQALGIAVDDPEWTGAPS